jgi:hypothetical protein
MLHLSHDEDLPSAMNYNIATLILVAIIGGIWWISPEASPRSSTAPATTAPPSRWYTTREVTTMTLTGIKRIPLDAEVERISDTEVMYRGVKFPIVPEEVMSHEQKLLRAEKIKGRQAVAERLTVIDARIREIENGYAEQQRMMQTQQQPTKSKYYKPRLPQQSGGDTRMRQELDQLQAERVRLMSSPTTVP